MPHLVLEYTKNLRGIDVPKLLGEFNQVLLATGQFGEADIKSRAIAHDVYAIGTAGNSNRAFVHIRLAILAGRSPEIRKSITEALMGVLRKTFDSGGNDVQATVDLAEMDRDIYCKDSFVPSEPSKDQSHDQ